MQILNKFAKVFQISMKNINKKEDVCKIFDSYVGFTNLLCSFSHIMRICKK